VALDDPERLKELLSAFGPVAIRRMFGGVGIFAEGIMFALVYDGELYLKADAETIPAYRTEGSGPFAYGAKGRRIVMSYWQLPDRLLDDADELAQWARSALRAAQRSAAIKRQHRRPATRGRNERRR
jgi:DNA transformation protein